jgi:hypothetical protein
MAKNKDAGETSYSYAPGRQQQVQLLNGKNSVDSSNTSVLDSSGISFSIGLGSKRSLTISYDVSAMQQRKRTKKANSRHVSSPVSTR